MRRNLLVDINWLNYLSYTNTAWNEKSYRIFLISLAKNREHFRLLEELHV